MLKKKITALLYKFFQKIRVGNIFQPIIGGQHNSNTITSKYTIVKESHRK